MAAIGSSSYLTEARKNAEIKESQPDTATYIRLLHMCGSTKDLLQGKGVHAQIIQNHPREHAHLLRRVVDMYLKCGSVEDARMVFERVHSHCDVVVWTNMIAASAEQGNFKQAAQFFRRMQLEGLIPDKVAFLAILKACQQKSALTQVHALITEAGFESDVVVGTALVKMYGKSGSVGDARRVFDAMAERNVVSWTSMITAYAKQGDCKEALQLLHQMQVANVVPNEMSFMSVLNACGRPEFLAEGKLVHSYIVKNGLELDVFVGTAVISMYGKCGSLGDARRMFNKLIQRNVVSWNAMIGAYAELGAPGDALKLFWQMQLEGMMPNKVTFVSVLNELPGKQPMDVISACISEAGLYSDAFVGTALLKVYASCGRLDDAWGTFSRMHQRDAAAWNSMMAACAAECKEDAVHLFRHMLLNGVVPTKITFVTVLNACGDLRDGEMLNAWIAENGFESDVKVGTALIAMYGNWGKLEEAEKVFDGIQDQDVTSWNTLITAHQEHGRTGLELLQRMHLEGFRPDKVTFVAILSSHPAVSWDPSVHAQIVESGLHLDLEVGTSLMDMYAKCGNVANAQRKFDELHNRGDVVPWNVMLAAYVLHGLSKDAFELTRRMHLQGVKPEKLTFVSLLNACNSPGALREGKLIHGYVVEQGYAPNATVGTALMSMYRKCQDLDGARMVFEQMHLRNVAAWNSMVAAYAECGHLKGALRLLQQMQLEGTRPDGATLVTVLNACDKLETVKQIHGYIVQSGCESDCVVGTSLVNMYGKCRSLEDASRVFKGNPRHDVVSWTVYIAAHVECGFCKEALQLFRVAQQEGVMPNKFTLLAMLSACTSLAAMKEGKLVHACVVESGWESDAVMVSALVNMYGKCGHLEDARRLFDNMSERAVVSWNAMIAVYAQHGHGKQALRIHWQMQQEGFQLDRVTLVSILSACSHAGLVAHGCECFGTVSEDHGITPAAEHYACMIDLFGRAGRLSEAECIAQTMPCQADEVVWNNLVGACAINTWRFERNKTCSGVEE